MARRARDTSHAKAGNPPSIRTPQSEIRNDAQDLLGIAKVLQDDVRAGRAQLLDAVIPRRNGD
jgi:hypothetical protein